MDYKAFVSQFRLKWVQNSLFMASSKRTMIRKKSNYHQKENRIKSIYFQKKRKEKKTDRTSGGIVGHTKNGEAIGAFDVENISILRVGSIGITVSGDFLENLSRDRIRRGGGSAEFSQHDRPTRHQRVQYRHPRASSLSLSRASLFRN